MSTSIVVREARAILMGRGALTGRYCLSPPWRRGEIQVEIWDGERFVWGRILKEETETEAFKKRLAGGLQLTDAGWFRVWVNYRRMLFVLAFQQAKCLLGLHRFESVLCFEGSGFVSKCRHCEKLRAERCLYWLSGGPNPFDGQGGSRFSKLGVRCVSMLIRGCDRVSTRNFSAAN